VRVLAAGNHERFAAAVDLALAAHGAAGVVASSANRDGVLEKAVLFRPDVLVVDINHRFELGGLDTAWALRRVQPSVGVVVISPYTAAHYLSAFPSATALKWSYILTQTARRAGELNRAVMQASWGLQYVDSSVDARLLGSGDRELSVIVRGVRGGEGSPARRRASLQRFRLGDYPQWD
jgi:DNA-binding NarL/FixJ family response regulator